MDSETPAVDDAPSSPQTVRTVKDDRYLETVSGRSKTVIDSALEEWIDQFELESFDEVDEAHCRDYGLYLKRKTERDDVQFAASTAHTYYAYVRAFLSFAVRDGYLDTNPAKTNDADEFLPSITADPDRQFWTPVERKLALRFCRERVDSALTPPKAPPSITLERYRDRAIVAVLGLTGVRGAEVFSVSGDDRRDGLTWTDVDVEGNTLTVLGKVQAATKDPYQQAQLPPRAASVLETYKRILDPPTDDWPVFPTNHYPSKRAALEAEFGGGRLETMLQRASIDDLLREHEVTPPALSTNGARTILKRLSSDLTAAYDRLEYDPDENEYLKPHGGRRGLGHELYEKGHSEVAQKSLRHSSMDVTNESYQNIQARETAQKVDEVLEDDSS
ncbi:integrase [Natronorubrum sp. JWXQ-INN-674]|uniref:Integrase n=1 Tax=Natronorubrum halalkaliphilum TaxID=2691917 RepID=A0A6B0VSU1_9EURY|nr:site-specific integrase [Natronorubrum halalkaliphilum]MXV63852.1 integrase [Natronorubrum halalkaliphilum]